MMVYKCDVLHAMSKLLQCGHRDARLIVFMHPAHKRWSPHVNGEDFVYFCQKSDQWNDVSKHLRESDVLSLGGAEGNLRPKTTNPEDRAVGIHYDVTSSR